CFCSRVQWWGLLAASTAAPGASPRTTSPLLSSHSSSRTPPRPRAPRSASPFASRTALRSPSPFAPGRRSSSTRSTCAPRASRGAGVDEGVAGLAASGDFASLAWQGVLLADESAEDAPSFDGTFTNRRFYRDALWMKRKSSFTIAQVDANGQATAPPAVVDA